MKFAMNGALTIGTLDGANVEIRNAVGAENFFLFGMTVDDVRSRLAEGYRPFEHYQSDEELRAAIDAIANGAFSKGDRELIQADRGQSALVRPVYAACGLPAPMSIARRKLAACGASQTVGRVRRFSTCPEWARSRRIVPSPSIAVASGTWNRCRLRRHDGLARFVRLPRPCVCRKLRFEHIGDVSRRPWHATRCVRSAEPGARQAHPCPMNGAFARCCNSSRHCCPAILPGA